MRQIGEPHLSSVEHWQEASQFIRQVIGEDDIEEAYRRQLLKALNQCSEPDSDVPTIGALPRLVCETLGGDPLLAAPVTGTWQFVRMAAKLFDDVEDDQPGADFAESINLATGLLFVASLALEDLPARGLPLDRVHTLTQALNRAMLRACTGQHADLAVAQTGWKYMDPEGWLEIAQAKSGEPLAWAAWAGALVAGANKQTLACYREYGYHLGVLLQVADDFHDVWSHSGDSDLATRQPTLPVCYALSVVQGVERTRLVTLLDRAAQGDAMAEAQARQWLTGLGAQAYLLVVARVQYRQALVALQRAGLDLPASHQLVTLLDGILPASKPATQRTAVNAQTEDGIESGGGTTE